MKTCEKCSRRWEDHFKFCGNCSHPLGNESDGAVIGKGIVALLQILLVLFGLWLLWPWIKAAIAFRLTQ